MSRTRPCTDCGMIPPDHHTCCPGWTDEDEAAIERREFERRLKEEPWTLLRDCAQESLYPGPAWSMDAAKSRLREAIKACEGMEEPS